MSFNVTHSKSTRNRFL